MARSFELGAKTRGVERVVQAGSLSLRIDAVPPPEAAGELTVYESFGGRIEMTYDQHRDVASTCSGALTVSAQFDSHAFD